MHPICTAPLNKGALHAAGHIYPGHTELLAHLTGTEEVSMMLSTEKVKVIHVHHAHRPDRRRQHRRNGHGGARQHGRGAAPGGRDGYGARRSGALNGEPFRAAAVMRCAARSAGRPAG
ncbi:4-hydroxythreonine-4-phosphate dehydrogenase PdxA [Streptomyces sp. BRA346]|uniref:4-hydroxythreonine-4-phosphate dehydrogenase PdxA n=1 Tax=Streptomyces sp. BRA346 TaxID=2878199 RepID=UPI004062CECA